MLLVHHSPVAGVPLLHVHVYAVRAAHTAQQRVRRAGTNVRGERSAAAAANAMPLTGGGL